MFQRQKIGHILSDMGVIAPAQIELILEKQKDEDKRFGSIGIESGLFKERDLAQALASQFQYEFINLDDVILDAELIASLPSDVPIKYTLVPLEKQEDTLVVAIADPTAVELLDQLEMQLGLRLILKIASKGQIERLIERGPGRSVFCGKRPKILSFNWLKKQTKAMKSSPSTS